jgi:hypothetical protein
MCPSWKMMEKVNGKDDIPYIMENNPNVWKHQPVNHGKYLNQLKLKVKLTIETDHPRIHNWLILVQWTLGLKQHQCGAH